MIEGCVNEIPALNWVVLDENELGGYDENETGEGI